MRQAWPLLLLAALLLALAPPLLAVSSTDLAVTEADAIEVNFANQQLQAHGHARLSYQGLELSADELLANRATGDVEARGNLVVSQRGRQLTGDWLHYNLHTEQGSLMHARVVEQGVIVTGDQITFSPDRIVAHHAQFTTCSEPHPHYAFSAGTITLTAQQTEPGQPPKAGRLTLDRARVTYRGHPLFSVPRYSVSVGDIGKKNSSPLPTTGWSRADGPFTTISYSLGQPDTPVSLGLSYRYTTFRGIRGFLALNAPAGPATLSFGYVRRQDPTDREIEPDDLESTTASVLVSREPEYGVVLPEHRLSRLLSVQASWLAGSYSEREKSALVERAAANRTSLNLLVRLGPYHLSPTVELSHGIGWRRATYSPGDEYQVRLYRHSMAWRASPRLELKLSHVTRRDSGETPFLFDGIGPRREIVAEVKWVINPSWRLRFVDYHDPESDRARDMVFEATRTAHCLEYTLGWRKERGSFYIGLGLAPPAASEVVPNPQPPAPDPQTP